MITDDKARADYMEAVAKRALVMFDIAIREADRGGNKALCDYLQDAMLRLHAWLGQDPAKPNMLEIIDYARQLGMTDIDAQIAWEMGVQAFLIARRHKARFDHDPTSAQEDLS